MKRIAVSGMGAVCGAGFSLPGIMTNLYSGERNPRVPENITFDLPLEYPVFEIPEQTETLAGRIASGSRYGAAEADLRKGTRTSLLTILSAVEALNMSELSPDILRKKRVGIAVGTTVGCTTNNEPDYKRFRTGDLPGTGSLKRFLDNNPADFLARYLGVSGPAVSIANACSSGTEAIGLGMRWIREGLCDLVIAGGADELSRITYLGFISLLISSNSPCRPFDKERSGLNLGEGAGLLVLEPEETLTRRNGRARGYVCGFGSYADAYHPTAPHPEGIGLKRSIQGAMDEAAITEKDIAFINAHGTSTPGNDKAEGAVISAIYPEDTPFVSTKAYTGHTLGAAGGIEAAITLQGLADSRIPGTAGFSIPDPECLCSPVSGITEIRGSYAVSHSLAFGGNNAVLVFEGADS